MDIEIHINDTPHKSSDLSLNSNYKFFIINTVEYIIYS